MMPSNRMPFSIITSITPALNSPRMPPPSSTNPVFISLPFSRKRMLFAHYFVMTTFPSESSSGVMPPA